MCLVVNVGETSLVGHDRVHSSAGEAEALSHTKSTSTVSANHSYDGIALAQPSSETDKMLPSKPHSTVSPSDVIVITCSSTHDAAHLLPYPSTFTHTRPRLRFLALHVGAMACKTPQPAASGERSPTRANRQGEAAHSLGSESHPKSRLSIAGYRGARECLFHWESGIMRRGTAPRCGGVLGKYNKKRMYRAITHLKRRDNGTEIPRSQAGSVQAGNITPRRLIVIHDSNAARRGRFRVTISGSCWYTRSLDDLTHRSVLQVLPQSHAPPKYGWEKQRCGLLITGRNAVPEKV
ncbi:hypothetical protein HD554DRAFT_2329510 [Boletus coccyginus]|nr:hypothetical protein HD554DRAFT_2329510 [Boletus coccyginus]